MTDSAARHLYSRDGIELWHGDCCAVLPKFTGIDLLVTDPPYHLHSYASRCETAALITDEEDAKWFRTLWSWMAAWMALVKATGVERAWIFSGWHQISPMLRIADIIGLTVQHVLVNPQIEYLLYCGEHSLAPIDVQSLEASHRQKAYLNRKDPAFLGQLLAASRPTCVIDPFAGEGSTLIACHRAGVRAIGIEMREAYASTIIDKLQKEP